MDVSRSTILIANADRLGPAEASADVPRPIRALNPTVEVLTPNGINQVSDYIQSGINGM
jgi:hypothetical protein